MAGSHEVRGSIPLGSTTCHRAGSQIRLVLRSGQQKPPPPIVRPQRKASPQSRPSGRPPPATLRTQHVSPLRSSTGTHAAPQRNPRSRTANTGWRIAQRTARARMRGPRQRAKPCRQRPAAPKHDRRPRASTRHPGSPPPRNDRGRLLSAAAPVSVTPLSRMRRTWPCRTRRRSTSHPRTAGSKTRSASAPARSHRRSGPSR